MFYSKVFLWHIEREKERDRGKERERERERERELERELERFRNSHCLGLDTWIGHLQAKV